jgi:hypothetical protein
LLPQPKQLFKSRYNLLFYNSKFKMNICINFKRRQMGSLADTRKVWLTFERSHKLNGRDPFAVLPLRLDDRDDGHEGEDPDGRVGLEPIL